jgi:hypothetical protein
MLDTAGDPVEAEGIGTVKLTLPGEFNHPLVLKNVDFAPRIGMNLISVPKLLRDRYSVVAHPQNVFVQRRGRTAGTTYHAEEDLLRCYVSPRSRERVQLARAPTNRVHADSLEPQAVDKARRPPLNLVVKHGYSKKMRAQEWTRPPKRCGTLGWDILTGAT